MFSFRIFHIQIFHCTNYRNFVPDYFSHFSLTLVQKMLMLWIAWNKKKSNEVISFYFVIKSLTRAYLFIFMRAITLFRASNLHSMVLHWLNQWSAQLSFVMLCNYNQKPFKFISVALHHLPLMTVFFCWELWRTVSYSLKNIM